MSSLRSFITASILFSSFTFSLVPLLALTSIPGAYALQTRSNSLTLRDDGWPVFPDDPPSCPICENNYANINSCAQACPVFANFSIIIFNPGLFVDVIKCACTDTFQSAYPQCADCFTRTGQTQFLNVSQDDVPSVLQGMRNVCSLSSILLGGAATADGEVPTTTSTVAPKPTSTASGARRLTIFLAYSGMLEITSYLAVVFSFAFLFL